MYKGSRRERHRRIQRQKRKNYKFSDKVHPVEGILSFSLAGTALAILLVSSILSFRAEGNAGIWIGLMGVAALLFCVMGVGMAFLAMRKKEIHYRFPVLGGFLSAILLLGYILIYVWGAVTL